MPAWVAIALSVTAGLHSWWSRRQAAQANRGIASVEQSLDLIAKSCVEALTKSDRPRGGASTEHMEPVTLPEFNVEFVRGKLFRLRNVSATTATNVRAEFEGFPTGFTRDLPAGITLPPLGSSAPFFVGGSWGNATPGELVVTCDERHEAVRVPMPPS